jgi:hypothetical protein
MRLFVSCILDFQVLSINGQQSLFERNLHDISSFSSNIFFHDTHFFDNAEYCGSFITIYGLKTIKQIKHLINQLDPDSTRLDNRQLFIAAMIFIMISSRRQKRRLSSSKMNQFHYGKQKH